MSLPLAAIDRLFDRLNATYGRDFMSRWEGQDVNAVKSSWAYELAGFARDLKPLAWALENLPERAPNVIEFRNLCRKSPSETVLQIPVKTDPEKIAKELLRLGELRSKIAKPNVGAKEWAHRILRRVEACEKVPPISIRFAKEALAASV